MQQLFASRRSRWAPALHLQWRTTCQTPKGRHLPFHKRSQFHSTTNLRQAEAFYTQHQDPTSATALPLLRTPPKIPQTRTEKIVQRHTVDLPQGKLVQSGDYVTLSPRHCMTHDNTWPVVLKYKSIGASKIYNTKQIVMALDHDVQNKSESNLKKYQQIEEFAKEQGVSSFYPAGRGIGHQIMVEEGYAWPDTLVVASDSHANMYGGVGCLGTALVRSDALSVWVTGRTWWQIPPITQVTFTGTLPQGVTGKDVIVALCGLFSKDEVLNHAIEFTGSERTMQSLPIDDRLAIANMTTEWGALTGLFPIDSVLKGWLRHKAIEGTRLKDHKLLDNTQRFTHHNLERLFDSQIEADIGAKYTKRLYLNLSTLSPYVSGPNSVKITNPLAKLVSDQIKIDRAYLVSCTNSRASDLMAAAKVFKDAAKENNGKIPKIADGVNFYIAAASKLEQIAAEATGDWQIMIEAGAQPLPSGCGPCIGLGTGLLQPGEVGISASNRNFKGRMGSTDAMAYLASPEVVAASALSGKISGPGRYQQPKDWKGVEFGEGADYLTIIDEALDKIVGQLDSIVANAEKEFGAETKTLTQQDEEKPVSILPGFPEKITGEIVFCDADNINTDGIYPGKLTYQDYVPTEQMAEACMHNYDPAFSSIVKEGDILVSGFSFGIGSSREQAATALLAKKIPLVVSGSFGNIFSRNSINNALMGLEIPKLVERLRQSFSLSSVQQQQGVTEPSKNQEPLESPSPATFQETSRALTRRTGWTLTWDVTRSKVEIDEGAGKAKWSVKVGELPANVQEIIARGGLEKWVKSQLEPAA